MVDYSLAFPGKIKPNIKYFFVGAAPWTVGGEEEAFKIGAATKNFEKYLAAAGIDRDECFTTNSVMHVPIQSNGKSRQPDEREINNCSVYLYEQMMYVNPTIIVALGSIALQALNQIRKHDITVKRFVGTGVKWESRYIFTLTHPSPMAVSFRGDTQQIEDYKALKRFVDIKTR